MSILVPNFSKFYFNTRVIVNQDDTIDFNEGSGEINATLTAGNYSLTNFGIELQRTLNTAGTLAYTISLDRATRLFTISAGANFDLLVATGATIGTTAFGTAGFTGADRTGATTYTSNVGAGSVYSPQFRLQSFVGPNQFQQAVEASVNKSASGAIEVVSFGNEQFYEFDMQFATNLPQPLCDRGFIKNNPTGKDELETFMQFLITKSEVEIMLNSGDPLTFDTVLLESAPGQREGIGYRLREQYDKGLPGYFNTSILKFRVVQ